jgi:polysaccharide export outer membrane protein
MNRQWRFVGVVLLLAACTACAGTQRLAQAPGPFATARQAPIDIATATKMATEFDAGAEEAYLLGNGDELTIDVWDRPEFTGHHVVGPDGRITMPVMGPVAVTDLTREQAASAVAAELRRYLSVPVVTVKVDRYVAQRVFILGRVTHPGALNFEGELTLLETIVRAGGLPVGGAGAEKAALARCAVFRGRDRVLWIDLKSLLNGSNLALNIRLKRNDTVYLPDSDDQLVYILGEVQRPGAFHLTPNMTLMDVVALAGGTSESADDTKISVVRPDEGIRREFSMRELLDPLLHLNVTLEEGDVIYVPKRGLAKFGYMLSRVSPLTGMIILGSALVP